MTMSTFDESKIRRGQPDNAGQFAAKHNSAPSAGLVTPTTGLAAPVGDEEIDLGDDWRNSMQDTHQGVWNVTARADDDPDIVNVDIDLYENMTHDSRYGSPEFQATVLSQNYGLVQNMYAERYDADLNTDNDDGWQSAGVSIRVPVDRDTFESNEQMTFAIAHQKLCDFTNESDSGTFGSEYFPARVWEAISAREKTRQAETNQELSDAIEGLHDIPAGSAAYAEQDKKVHEATAAAIGTHVPRGVESVDFDWHADGDGMVACGARGDGATVDLDDAEWSDVDFIASNIRNPELAGMTQQPNGAWRMQVKR